MDRWEYFNPNPVKDKRTGDCVVRAICKATGFDWETVFAGLMVQACTLSDMPSANYVWGAYLYKHGYRRKLIEQSERYIYSEHVAEMEIPEEFQKNAECLITNLGRKDFGKKVVLKPYEAFVLYKNL